jgi:hypothetical protein
MKFHKKIIISIIFSLGLLGLVHTTNAQIPDSIDGIDISSSPDNPNPGQNVNINIESYSTDLNGASIVWMVNGKNYKQGTGIKSISIKAPELGKNTNILVAIMTIEGKQIKKAITIKSGSIDLVLESDGYIPPLYKGRSSFAYQNSIRLIAVPHLASNDGKELDPKTLLYTWSENDKVIQNQSGYGKQVLVLKEETPKEMNMKVEVSTKTGSQKAVSYMVLNPTDPSILFYEEDPLYGILYNKALLGDKTLDNQEINIVSAPYYFNMLEKNSPLSFVWSINNLERPELSTSQTITLRSKGDTSGSSLVKLEIRNSNEILQGGSNSIKLNFNKKNQ